MRSFVFMDILALFPRFLCIENQRHQRPLPCGERVARVASRVKGFFGSRLLDIFPSSFVFIYILALFPRFRVARTAAFAVRGLP